VACDGAFRPPGKLARRLVERARLARAPRHAYRIIAVGLGASSAWRGPRLPAPHDGEAPFIIAMRGHHRVATALGKPILNSSAAVRPDVACVGLRTTSMVIEGRGHRER